tara:strand:+ start:10383 stop:11390 length:1008 start_codon:yes stop_codon:yes gene_type:complete
MEKTLQNLPNVLDIQSAANRISKYSIVTPLLESSILNKMTGARILIKAETLQRTGAFKFRGAMNALTMLTPRKRKMGVIAYSSGNHAQAIACAAQILETKAHVVMPDDSPKVKLEGARYYGAEIHEYNRNFDDREKIGHTLAAENKLTLIKPFDDPAVIAGQGTAGLEIIDQCNNLRVKPDMVMAPVGGGGLIAGIGLAIRNRWPEIKIYAAEPYGWDDHRLSIDNSKRSKVSNSNVKTICDALLAPMPGEITFLINKHLLETSIVVTDKEVVRAMALAFKHLKLVIEPGGAVALAAALKGQIEICGKTIIVIASGGNVDMETFVYLLSKEYTND